MGAHPYAILFLLLTASAGCASLAEQQDSIGELTGQVQQLESQLAQTQSIVEALSSTQQANTHDLAQRISGVNAQLETLPQATSELCAQRAAAATKCEDTPPARQVVMRGDKMVLGELERVWIEPPGANLIARVDTGAHSSSVHAENLVEFERDGDDWVRFDLVLDDEITTLERQVERYVRVYQQADKSGTRRPVVSMRLRLGDVQNSFDFTLADRSHLEYQMLLGRNFLADMALVDVGKQFVQPEYRPPQG